MSNQKFSILGVTVVYQGRYSTTSTATVECTDGQNVEITKGVMVRVDKIEKDYISLRFYSDSVKKWVETKADQNVLDNLFQTE